MKKPGDKWFVVDLQGLYIESGWRSVADANERAVAFKREGGQPKVMTKPRVGSLELDPDDAESWRPKRTNPGAYRTPFICPACGGKGPGDAATVVHKPGCVLVQPKRASAVEPWRQAVKEVLYDMRPRSTGSKLFPDGPASVPYTRMTGFYLQRLLDEASTPAAVQKAAKKLLADYKARRRATAAALDVLSNSLPRSNPPLEEHVEYEPQRAVRALRTRYGVEGVEHMLHEGDEDHDIDERAEKAAYMQRHEEGLRENPSRSGEDIYRMWHQKEPRHATKKRAGVDWEDELVCVGKAHNIVYRSGKWEKGNKTNDYIHHFDSKPSVYMKPGVVEDAGASKSVKALFGPLRNPDGQAEVAELAKPISFALDDGSQDGYEIAIHTGAKVYGGVDKKTVLIIDPVWGPIVIKGGKMYFDERGIVL
jgi:hypothetical protein